MRPNIETPHHIALARSLESTTRTKAEILAIALARLFEWTTWNRVESTACERIARIVVARSTWHRCSAWNRAGCLPCAFLAWFMHKGIPSPARFLTRHAADDVHQVTALAATRTLVL